MRKSRRRVPGRRYDAEWIDDVWGTCYSAGRSVADAANDLIFVRYRFYQRPKKYRYTPYIGHDYDRCNVFKIFSYRKADPWVWRYRRSLKGGEFYKPPRFGWRWEQYKKYAY